MTVCFNYIQFIRIYICILHEKNYSLKSLYSTNKLFTKQLESTMTRTIFAFDSLKLPESEA